MIGLIGHVSDITADKTKHNRENIILPNSSMIGTSKIFKSVRFLMITLGFFLFSTGCYAVTIEGSSVDASLDCTSSPCPWGTTINRQVVTWPGTVDTVTNRLGYTASQPIYLLAQNANGAVVTSSSGSVTVRAGHPDASSHTTIATLSDGESYTVSGLAADEVLWISSLSNFTFVVNLPEPTTDPVDPVPPVPGLSSGFVSLNCTSSPCPWGPTPGSNALLWPDTVDSVTYRLGYTAASGIYLTSSYANGTIISIHSGSATLKAGNPDDTSFRSLGTLSAGQSMTVAGLLDGEVLSVLNNTSAFNYEAVLAVPTDPTTDPTPTDPPPPGTETNSEFASLICNGDNCPWGPTPGTHAIVWPDTSKPVYERFDYAATLGIYLPRAYADGATISVLSGTATLRAGIGNSPSFRTLASLSAGESYTVSGLSTGEVISVTSDNSFSYATSLPASPPQPVGDSYSSVPTYWRCTTVDCSGADWEAHSVAWPDWAAYSSNDRTGDSRRTTFGSDGGLIYPYMGTWSNGCEVSVVSGIAVIIEWERGTDVWTTTPIGPGETYIINLTDPQDGSLFESWGPFTVALNNCTPQLLP